EPRPFLKNKSSERLTLGELERTACLCTAVLLALDDARVAGQEAALLEDRAQARLEVGQRLGDAVTNGTGLAGKTAAGDGGDDVELAVTGSCDDRLLQDHLQDRTGEVGFERLAVDDDLAGARLDPHAGNGVLALAGCVGTALGVNLLDVNRGGSGRSCSGDAEVLERGEVGHYQALLVFLLFSLATSRATGCWASCGWLEPAYTRRFFIWRRPSGPRGTMRSTAFSRTRSGK